MQDIFSEYIYSDEITFKHARGISERTGKEFHIFHEILYFLDGEAEFISEEFHMPLQSETLIVIPKETFHQVVFRRNPEQYYRCFIQFPDCSSLSGMISDNMSGIRVIRADDEIKYLFGKLTSLCTQADRDASMLLRSVLTILLNTMKTKKETNNKEKLQNDCVRHAINYINQNIDKKLLVPEIAEACNVSVSTLSHIFKHEMNIPIHKFIVKKRLINAHHKIVSGQLATNAALECGFADYSGFYKQYKKAFGFPPSKK